jgi:hypothetical protein
VNADLGRRILDHVAAHPEQLDMSLWGEEGPCGTPACLAGRALIFSGWTLVDDGTFREPGGDWETGRSATIADEARRLLRLDDGDFWRLARPEETGEGSHPAVCLFEVGDDEAVRWLRRLVEREEANHA